MASYLQNQPVQFNPYTPSVNADLYSKVGMYKQGQYEEGVKQSQSFIDSVAGLPIYRDVDKQYLQQKLKGVQSQINNLAGADFSDHSVVGKIKTYAAAVANDINIQNAVQSTQAVKSFFQSQKELKEKHPELYPISWEEQQNEGVQRYMSNKEPGVSYNGPRSANSYTNYANDLTTQLKELDPTITTEISPDGQFQYKVEQNSTISAEKIQGVINSYLATNPGAQESMMADAKHIYKYDTPSTLLQRVNNYTNSTIAALQADNANRVALMKNNLGSADYLQDQQNKILANNTIIAQMQDKAKNYSSLLEDPNNALQVKIKLFQDNFTTGKILQFSKNDLDRNIIENKNAIEAQHQANSDRSFGLDIQKNNLEWLKENRDPTTGLPLTVNSPYFSAAHSGGTPGGASTENNVTFLPNPLNIGETNKLSALDMTGFQAKMDGIRAELGENKDGSIIPNSLMGKLRDSWMESAKAIDPNFSKQSPEQIKQQFDAYYKTQQANFTNGKELDPNYSEFRKLAYPKQMELTMMHSLQDEAMRHATEVVPIEGGGSVRVNPYTQEGTGKTVDNIYIPYDSPYINDFTRFTKDLVSATTGAALSLSKDKGFIPPIYGSSRQSPKQLLEEAKNTILEKYKNSPIYSTLKNIANSSSGLTDAQKIVDNIDTKVRARNAEASKYIAEHGRNFNNNEYLVGQKEENIAAARNAAYADLVAANGVTIKKDGSKDTYTVDKYSPDDKKFIPIGKYKGNDGNYYWQVKIHGNDPVSILSTQRNESLPNEDPLDYLVKAIDMYGTTPIQGEGVLTSDNGKIRYNIAKGFTDGTYKMGIIVGGKSLPVAIHQDPLDPTSPYIPMTHPAQAIDKINKIQSGIYKTFNIVPTSEDIYKALTLSPSDFTKFIQSKYKK